MKNNCNCNHSDHSCGHNNYYIYGSSYCSGKLGAVDGAGIGILFVIFGVVVILGLISM